MECIVYKPDVGPVVILVPAPECLLSHTVEEIAMKDVPFGKPFKIISTDSIPTDMTFRDAWDVDETLLTDGVGAESNEFTGGRV